jgi:hypothetical protein
VEEDVVIFRLDKTEMFPNDACADRIVSPRHEVVTIYAQMMDALVTTRVQEVYRNGA